MHNQVKHKVNLQNKRQVYWLDAPGLAFITPMLAFATLDARGPPYSHGLGPLGSDSGSTCT
jgi:hypothetical protein